MADFRCFAKGVLPFSHSTLPSFSRKTGEWGALTPRGRRRAAKRLANGPVRGDIAGSDSKIERQLVGELGDQVLRAMDH